MRFVSKIFATFTGCFIEVHVITRDDDASVYSESFVP